MKISDLIAEGANVYVTVSVADLREFFEEVAQQVMKERDDEREKQEQRFSQKEAARYLGKSVPTLWRWQKEGYLQADGYVGSQPFYYKKTLDSLAWPENKDS